MAKQPARPVPRKGAPPSEEKAGSWMGKWGQIVLSALGGAVLTLVTIVLAFAQVRTTAEANQAALADMVPRVRTLEVTGAAETAATLERWRNLNRRLDKQDEGRKELRLLLEKLRK